MKYLFIILFSLGSLQVNAQEVFSWYFDGADTVSLLKIVIDTAHANNIWQIGRPQKAVFDSAYSAPNVLVTDTVHTYPKNDTSVFTIAFPPLVSTGWWPGAVIFHYRLDIDSQEITRIEVSNDSGISWIDIMQDSTHYFMLKTLGSVTDTGWRSAYINISRIGFGHNWGELNGALRFTFISDSIDTHKDGWMIDDIQFEYFVEDVPEFKNEAGLEIYPNPSNGVLSLKLNASVQKPVVTVYDLSGKKVYETDYDKNFNCLDLPLPNGTYILKLNAQNYSTQQKIIISR